MHEKHDTKRKKKTLKKRGGSGAPEITGLNYQYGLLTNPRHYYSSTPTLKGSDVERLTEPLHLYSKNYLQTNVLNRIYGENC